MTPEAAALVTEHLPWAVVVARTYRRGLPREVGDEVHSGAMEGLVDAARRFRAGLGIPFRPYAKVRIRGAIYDAVRSADWRTQQSRRSVARLDEARTYLRGLLGDEPTPSEIARCLGIRLPQVRRMLQYAADSHVSLDEPDDRGRTLAERIGATDDSSSAMAELEARSAVVHQALQKLRHRERRAIELRYLEGLSLVEAGEELGVSASRVCQLCSAGVRRLRATLVDDLQDACP